jgi:hypothetical protein
MRSTTTARRPGAVEKRNASKEDGIFLESKILILEISVLDSAADPSFVYCSSIGDMLALFSYLKAALNARMLIAWV